jgi:ligand-binding SRPBCC domain-containing protein
MPYSLPSTFTIYVRRVDVNIYQLSTSQILPMPRREVFTFFENPQNLFDITPDWLRFVIKDREIKSKVFEGAEFYYTIRWYGVNMEWRSKIIDYKPPERFTDVQLVGPYRSWEHLHTFEDAPEGTLMRDTVTYELPFGLLGRMVHALAVRWQLEDIFSYRAMRIDEWSSDELRKKSTL